MDSYRNSFASLTDLSHLFKSPNDDDHNHIPPPTISYLLNDHRHPPSPTGFGDCVKNKECERRGKMANLYSILHSYLPNLASDNQPSREKIVTEAIDLIKRLEDDKSRLENQLLINKNVVAADDDVGVATSSLDVVAFEIKWKRGKMKKTNTTTTSMMVSLIDVFRKYRGEILTASVVVGEDEGSFATVAVTAIVDGNDVVLEMIKGDLLLLLSQVHSISMVSY